MAEDTSLTVLKLEPPPVDIAKRLEQEQLAKELADYFLDLKKLAHAHSSASEYATRRVQELQLEKHDFNSARSQRIKDLCFYRKGCASQFADQRLLELGEPFL
jgi:hypothetical protein